MWLSPPSLIAALHRVAEHPRVWNCRCSACCFLKPRIFPFISIAIKGPRDQQKTTRRVGVGYSRKLTLSTLMMFILFTSFLRFEKKQSQQQKKFRDSGFDIQLWIGEVWTIPLANSWKIPSYFFSTRSTFKLKFYHTWGCRGSKPTGCT